MKWAVAQTEPRQEHLARIWLMRSGYETYQPRLRDRHGRIMPLFPSYLFVRIVSSWYPVLWTPRVVRVLMDGEQPASVPDVVLLKLRRREVGGFVKLPRKTWRIGQRVRVMRGIFIGHIALYDGQSGDQRVRVLLELLGQQSRVELAADAIEPIPDIAPEKVSEYKRDLTRSG